MPGPCRVRRVGGKVSLVDSDLAPRPATNNAALPLLPTPQGYGPATTHDVCSERRIRLVSGSGGAAASHRELTTILTTTTTTAGLPDTFTYTTIEPYRAWSHHRPVPTDHRFVFIRSASATPFRLPALKPQDGSNSSGLTSTNVSVLISPQLHTREVAGSIQPGLLPDIFPTQTSSSDI
jgi:hypothetical protein